MKTYDNENRNYTLLLSTADGFPGRGATDLIIAEMLDLKSDRSLHAIPLESAEQNKRTIQ